jgi:hypothetical protein
MRRFRIFAQRHAPVRLRRFGRSKMLPMYFASAFVEKQARDEAAFGTS